MTCANTGDTGLSNVSPLSLSDPPRTRQEDTRMTVPQEQTPVADITTGSVDRLALTIEEAAERLGIGRTMMYSLVKSGEVESVTIGRLRRIPAECLTEYVQRLRTPHEQSNPAA